MLEKHILPKLGKHRIDQIGKKEISNLHLSFKETPYRANRILELLSPIFNMTISWDLIAKNPVKGTKKFDEQKRERYICPTAK
jgi:D-mannonate dehydratase